MSTDTTSDTPTGEQPVITDGEDTPEVRDDLLAGLTNTVLAISGLIPARLWTRVGIYDHGSQEAVADIEILARGVDEARQISESLPWGGPVHAYVQPGESTDHYCWDGVLWGVLVRIVGLELLPGGERS